MPRPGGFSYRAHRLRNPPVSESILHRALEKRGITFAREQPFGFDRHRMMFVDVWFKGERVAVEIDGIEHRYKLLEDAARDAYLVEKDVVVLRFSNAEVNANVEHVVNVIEETLIERQYMRLRPSSLPGSKRPRLVEDKRGT